MLADSGYLSQSNVEHCEAAKIEPLISLGRERHHVDWRERFAAAPSAPPKTPAGRKLYALRKQTPEPVFGIIKSAMGHERQKQSCKATACGISP